MSCRSGIAALLNSVNGLAKPDAPPLNFLHVHLLVLRNLPIESDISLFTLMLLRRRATVFAASLTPEGAWRQELAELARSEKRSNGTAQLS